jgi:NADH dehydrogenase FAD-containing subunit
MGSEYIMPFHGENVFNSTSSEDMIKATEALQTATSAAVIGTGSVGIEIAGEIVTKYPQVKLNIISSSELFLERTVPAANATVSKFFAGFPSTQVQLFMGERVVSFKDNVLTTNKGTEIVSQV